MGVSAKGRRRISYQGQNFVWWVAPENSVSGTVDDRNTERCGADDCLGG